MSRSSARVRSRFAAVAIAAVTCGLAWAGPRPSQLPHSPAGVAGWLSVRPVDETVAVLAGAVAELGLLWLCLGALLVALGRLPGLTGRFASALALRLTPSLVRRAVETALGVTVVTASAAAAATPEFPTGPAGVPPAASSGAGSGRHILGDGGTSGSLGDAGRAPRISSLDRPSTRPLPVSPGHPPAPPPALSPAPRLSQHVVVVRPGDSLWRIAARQLGPGATEAEIAAAWPRWYAANRGVVGPNPDLLLPGQRLLPPR